MATAELRITRLQAARDEALERLEAAKPGSIDEQVARLTYRDALLALTLALAALWGG